MLHTLGFDCQRRNSKRVEHLLDLDIASLRLNALLVDNRGDILDRAIHEGEANEGGHHHPAPLAVDKHAAQLEGIITKLTVTDPTNRNYTS